MAPVVESSPVLPARRWWAEAREAKGMKLPAWTRADDSDDEDDHHATLRARRLRRKQKRDIASTTATEAPSVPTTTITGRAPPKATDPASGDATSPDDSPDEGVDTPSESASEGDDNEQEEKDPEEENGPSRKQPERLPPPPPPPPTSTSDPVISAPQETSTVSQSFNSTSADAAVFVTRATPDLGAEPTPTVTMVMTTLVGPGLPTPPPLTPAPLKTFTIGPGSPGELQSTQASSSTDGVQSTESTPALSVTTISNGTSSTDVTTGIASPTGIVAAPIVVSSGASTSADGTALPVRSITTSSSRLPSTTTHSAAPGATREAEREADREADNWKITHPNDGPSKTNKIAIAVGTVGGVIFLALLCWLAWVLIKRSRARKRNDGDDDAGMFRRPSRSEKMLGNVPFLKTRFSLPKRGWTNIEEGSRSMSEKKTPGVAQPAAAPVSRRLDSQFFAPDQPMGIASNTSLPQIRYIPEGVSPASTMLEGSTAVHGSDAAAAATRHLPKESMSSTQAQYNQPLRSPAPPATSENRQTLDSYYVTKRQTGLSELSSISSGFGDGDIVIAPRSAGLVTPLRHPPVAASAAGPRRSQLTVDDRRDTVLTEASEDQPPRFRSINSWVRQQTGRVRRAQAPPVPILPPEQEFGLMMPDGEEPRRVEMPSPGAPAARGATS